MIPYGKIRSVKELGALVRQRRKDAGVLQADAAALLDDAVAAGAVSVCLELEER